MAQQVRNLLESDIIKQVSLVKGNASSWGLEDEGKFGKFGKFELDQLQEITERSWTVGASPRNMRARQGNMGLRGLGESVEGCHVAEPLRTGGR